MIDAHIHVVPPHLPGAGSLSPILNESPEAVADRLRSEMQSAGIQHALAMGQLGAPPDDPLGVETTLRIARLVPGLHAIGVADPTRTDADHLKRVAEVLTSGRVKGLKAYLGYVHFGPDHAGYIPYYELAARFQIPFIFHTGDTYSPRAKLRFAQPLLVDDVAVDHPNVRFVLAHLGNPWLTEAAEVVYKNVNVWADLSGLALGDVASFTDEEREETLRETITAVSRAFRYAERPNRFLYGSDWPLAPMREYGAFVKAAIPEKLQEMVFEENGTNLFRLG
jgi:predicted TIM-barrel fold metal-dependent hydrolase